MGFRNRNDFGSEQLLKDKETPVREQYALHEQDVPDGYF
jgi:hypothetical protein